MAYTIGVSSGEFGVAAHEEKTEYIGLHKKAVYGMFKGVKFTQIDLETISEFAEPLLKERMEQVRKMGIEYGFHGETKAMRQSPPLLDSAIISDYKEAHERAEKCFEEAGKLKAKYFLLHASETNTFISLWQHLQPTTICDIWGRPLSNFFDENPDILDWAVKQDFIEWVVGKHASSYYDRKKAAEIEEKMKKNEISKNEADKMLEDLEKDVIKKITLVSDQAWGAERIAYWVTAKWMQNGKNCPAELKKLWKAIAGKENIDDAKSREGLRWVPAVSAAYIWGHFRQDMCPKGARYKSLLEPLKKHELYFVIESAMAGAGEELNIRLIRPTHFVELIKAIGSPWVKAAMDFEHMLGAMIDPKKEIEALGPEDGQHILVMHLGYPTPLQPAHIPIPLGSEAHYYIYERLYELRKKGFKNGYLIFERTGGKDPIERSIEALRLVVKYLELDTPPKNLPDEFYGIEKGGTAITRQLLTIKDHALDPLKGLLAVPEEEYGFLGSASAGKGKGKEWEKEKYK